MRIAIVGAGAVGSFVGARLARENEVVLIGRGPHIRAIKRRGLRIDGERSRLPALQATDRVGVAATADLVVLTTKAYDTSKAATQLRRAKVEAPVLSLQNGLTNLPDLRRALRANPLIGGSIVLGVTRIGPGHIRFGGGGRAIVGAARGPPTHAKRVAGLFSRAGLPTRTTRDLHSVLWSKAIINAAINPLTAVLRCPNGELLGRPDARVVSTLAALEAAEVGRADGARVGVDPWPAVRQVLVDTRTNKSSMLQDVEAGRPTEVGAITGEIVRIGRKRAIPTPVNRALLDLVSAL